MPRSDSETIYSLIDIAKVSNIEDSYCENYKILQ